MHKTVNISGYPGHHYRQRLQLLPAGHSEDHSFKLELLVGWSQQFFWNCLPKRWGCLSRPFGGVLVTDVMLQKTNRLIL